MGEKSTTEIPNCIMTLRQTAEGEVVPIGFTRLRDFGESPLVLVGFSVKLIKQRDPDKLYFDESEIRVAGYRFENLGYNPLIDGYIGRLIESEAAHG